MKTAPISIADVTRRWISSKLSACMSERRALDHNRGDEYWVKTVSEQSSMKVCSTCTNYMYLHQSVSSLTGADSKLNNLTDVMGPSIAFVIQTFKTATGRGDAQNTVRTICLYFPASSCRYTPNHVLSQKYLPPYTYKFSCNQNPRNPIKRTQTKISWSLYFAI